MSRFKWKNFIQGPNLHDTVSTYSTVEPEQTEPQNGEEVSKIYQEIINEPSSSSTHTNTQLPKVRKNSTKKCVLKSPEPPPSFGLLLKLAEANKFDLLRSHFETHTEIDLNTRDEFGWTLLMVAAVAGASETVELLLEKGADYTLTDRRGQSALQLAQKKHRRQVCEIIQDFSERVVIKEEDQASACSRHHENSAGFCDACGFKYQDQTVHTRSIGHLLSTSEGIQERTHFGIPESNVGFQLMLKTGWDKQSGLGPEGRGQKFPVKTILKQDRVGLGSEGERKKARITHFAPFDPKAVQRPEVKSGERTERKTTVARKEQARRKTKEVQKEINYRRELGSL